MIWWNALKSYSPKAAVPGSPVAVSCALFHLRTRLKNASNAQWSANISGGLKTDSKYSNTNVYTPFLNRFCAAPLDVIYYFLDGFWLHIQHKFTIQTLLKKVVLKWQ
jgi:hypothetical protein